MLLGCGLATTFIGTTESWSKSIGQHKHSFFYGSEWGGSYGLILFVCNDTYYLKDNNKFIDKISIAPAREEL